MHTTTMTITAIAQPCNPALWGAGVGLRVVVGKGLGVVVFGAFVDVVDDVEDVDVDLVDVVGDVVVDVVVDVVLDVVVVVFEEVDVVDDVLLTEGVVVGD